jgi:flagellar hook-associated protein 2
MTFSVGGLASGLDTKSIVSQLMAVEGRGKTRLEWNKALWESRQSTWSSLNGKLNSLQGFADILNNPSTWQTSASASSDAPTKVTGTINGTNQAAGAFAISVSQLASAEVWDAANSVVASGADTLTITTGSGPFVININGGDDDTAIMNAINAAPGIDVTASLNGGKLRITHNSTGAASDFTVVSGGTLAADLGIAESNAGTDATFTIDGNPYTRATNTGLSGILTGVDLNLLGTTASAATLTVTADGPADTDDIKGKIMNFVNGYNAVVDLINSKTSEAKVAKPTNLSQYLQGPMSRDYMFSSVGYDLRRWTTDVVSGLSSGSRMLSDIGITTGNWSSGFNSDNVTGKLVVDEDALETAIENDPTAVQAIFSTSGGGAMAADGISRRVSSLVSGWRAGGKVDLAMTGASSQVTKLQTSIDKASERLTRKQAYYERMFAALESSLGKLQSQGTWLSGQLSSLTGSGQLGS